MFKLQLLNVIKEVETEEAKTKPIAKGFKEIVEKVEKSKKGRE